MKRCSDLSILPESYCNMLRDGLDDYALAPFNSPRVLLQLESSASPGDASQTFNSPRVLLQLSAQSSKTRKQSSFQFSQSLIATQAQAKPVPAYAVFQFSQSLIATPCPVGRLRYSRRFQFSQSLIATGMSAAPARKPTFLSILPESYCNTLQLPRLGLRP